MLIQVVIPKSLKLKEKITSYYTDLYIQYRKENPEAKDYTYKKLRQNISNVAAFSKETIDELNIKPSRYNAWSNIGWKEYYYSHWYFAIEIVRNSNNQAVAMVKDAHYEAEHHNDEMQTQPYDESVKKALSLIERIENL